MNLSKQSKMSIGEIRLPPTLCLIHWICAVAVFYLFVSSWWMLSLPLPSEESRFRVIPFQLHKNVGISLFILILWMIVSFTQRVLKARLQLRALSHGAIYFLLFLCCISGYLSSSFSGWETQLWWIVDLPSWANENEELNQLFSDLHLWACWMLLFLIVTHIGAAIYHSLKGDGVVDRIIGRPEKFNS